MKASVIIPTYKRPDHIKLCLEALTLQEEKEHMEVIIIDDGGDEDTKIAVESSKHTFPFQIIYKAQPKKGRSAARNLGVKEANGDIIIFIGDDIITTPKWLKTHLDFHRKHQEESLAAVGHITWYPKLDISRYMIWLENGGPLLKFKGLRDNEETDVYHFYTGNVSMKRSLIQEEGFNESVDVYGWEDIELGARLKKEKNLKIFYLKDALAYHNHLYEESLLPSYAKNMGYSACAFQKNIHDIRIIPPFHKRVIFAIISPLSPLLKNIKKEWYWYALLKKNFLKGMKQYREEKK